MTGSTTSSTWFIRTFQWLLDIINFVLSGLYEFLYLVFSSPIYLVMIIILALDRVLRRGVEGRSIHPHRVLLRACPRPMGQHDVDLGSCHRGSARRAHHCDSTRHPRCARSVGSRLSSNPFSTSCSRCRLWPTWSRPFSCSASARLRVRLRRSSSPCLQECALTELAIRQVNSEVVEAGQAFGASSGSHSSEDPDPAGDADDHGGRQPGHHAGPVDGRPRRYGRRRRPRWCGRRRHSESLDVPLAVEAGLAVVVIAIFLDRVTAALGRKTPIERARKAAAA